MLSSPQPKNVFKILLRVCTCIATILNLHARNNLPHLGSFISTVLFQIHGSTLQAHVPIFYMYTVFLCSPIIMTLCIYLLSLELIGGNTLFTSFTVISCEWAPDHTLRSRTAGIHFTNRFAIKEHAKQYNFSRKC